ncbi:MAG: hypothetical protein ACRDZX_14545, partial [Acidimicrobiales bacterium]
MPAVALLILAPKCKGSVGLELDERSPRSSHSPTAAARSDDIFGDLVGLRNTYRRRRPTGQAVCRRPGRLTAWPGFAPVCPAENDPPEPSSGRASACGVQE